MAKNITPAAKAKPVSHFIREWRKHRRMTQDKLAELIGITSGAISQLENGVFNYTQPTLEGIASALDCTPADLLGGPPNREPATPETRLRSALLAFGVDREDLSRAISAVKIFTDDDDEQLISDPTDDQFEPSSPRRVSEPSE